MAFSQETIEQLHNRGKMPDWAYYQQNGRSAQDNYRSHKYRSNTKGIDNYLIYQLLIPILEKSLKQILQSLFQD